MGERILTLGRETIVEETRHFDDIDFDITEKPPDWMERFGLAWVFRLITNPRKMWSRYLIYNTKFLIKASGFLIRGK